MGHSSCSGSDPEIHLTCGATGGASTELREVGTQESSETGAGGAVRVGRWRSNSPTR